MAVRIPAAILLLALLAFLGLPAGQRLRSRWAADSRGRVVCLVFLIAVYLTYSWFSRTLALPDTLLVLAYVAGAFAFRGFAAILWVWLPIEFGLLWFVDPVVLACFAMCLAVLAFPSLPFRIEVNRGVLRDGLLNFAAFAVVGIPLGMWLGFVRFGPDPARWWEAPGSFVLIFLFNALPEEILFRGLMQEWFEKQSGSRWGALAAASVMFGCAHLNNGPPVPNYDYAVMAGVAGLFYGRAWMARKSVAAPALTHALVNTVWRLMFR